VPSPTVGDCRSLHIPTSSQVHCFVYVEGGSDTPGRAVELLAKHRIGFRRRIDRLMLAEIAWPPGERPHVFVCGPTPLVEAAAAALVALGHDPALVKTERFGPTGKSA